MERPRKKRTWALILAGLVGFLLLFLAVTAATVSAARRRELNATPTPSLIPTAEPTPTPLPNYHALAFDPELSKMEDMNAVPEEHRAELGREFWVDITPEEQLNRFNARQADPNKTWKITEEDWRNRDKYPQYKQAVDDMFRLTSTTFAPWIVLESDDNRYARVQALRAINEALEERMHK